MQIYKDYAISSTTGSIFNKDTDMKQIRLALAQMNSKVGDLSGNSKKIIELIHKARESDVDIIAFPEMAITGYPPEDLIFKPKFIEDNLAALNNITAESKGITAVIGFADRAEGVSAENSIFNAAALVSDGIIEGVYRKVILPNYGVFDERRHFAIGTKPFSFVYEGVPCGINICEDVWHPQSSSGIPTIAEDVSLLININASPFHTGKQREREANLAKRVNEKAIVIVYTNMVGGQDELVFDGGSMVMDINGEIIASAPHFEEKLLIVDINIDKSKNMENSQRPLIKSAKKKKAGTFKPTLATPIDLLDEVYGALVLGTRDYVRKSGFNEVVIGLSGGIDSALTAAIAVDALGAENVSGIAMPSPYSSPGSINDARQLAENMDIKFDLIKIEKPFNSLKEALSPLFEGLTEDVTEENLQARIRGNILMAVSNKLGKMVLTTGNKSEVGVGYSTLYGDMAGGFNVLKDVPKTMVYRLARHRNDRAGFSIIPEDSITKPPSAELRPDQTDQDSLPDYEILDGILKSYVEENRSAEDIVSEGFDPAIVEKIIRLVDCNEYKRRQAAPGVKITPKAFGRDRRMPIVNGYRGKY